MSCSMSYEIVLKSDKEETIVSAMNDFNDAFHGDFFDFIQAIKHVENYYILRQTSFDSFYSINHLFRDAGKIAKKYGCQIEIIIESKEAERSYHYYHDGKKSIYREGVELVYEEPSLIGNYGPFIYELSEPAYAAFNLNPSLQEKWYGFHLLTLEAPDYYIGMGCDNIDRHIDLSMYNQLILDCFDEGNVLETDDETLYEYDDNGTLIHKKDHWNEFWYNPNGKLTRLVFFDTCSAEGEIFYEYDDEGKLLRECYSGGYEVKYEYKKGRLSKEWDSEGNKAYHFYDADGNQCRKLCSNLKDQIVYDNDFKGHEYWYGYDENGEKNYKINRFGEESIIR